MSQSEHEFATSQTPHDTVVMMMNTGWIGKTVGIPMLTPSGYVVSIQLGEEDAYNLPTGSTDVAVVDLLILG